MTGRFAEIDTLKALGILTVILIHALRAPWDPTVAPVETAVRPLLRFAVPAFLFASGFLYATRERVSLATTRRRLLRLLLPYLVCSLAAQVFWELSARPDPRTGSLVLDLLFGWSFGPYYYVFVILIFVVLAPLLARVPRGLALPLLAVLLAVQGLFETGRLFVPFHLAFRNPLLWAAYFFAGWTVRLHYGAIRRAVTRARWAATAGCAAVGVALFAATQGSSAPGLRREATWLLVYATLALAFVLSCGRRAPAPVRRLSDATYGIYLLHMFFVVGLQSWSSPAPHAFDAGHLALLWCGGLFGSLGVIALAHLALGARRARFWIGA